MKTTQIQERFLIIVAIFVIVLFLILNIYTPLIADDYSYSDGIHSVSDIFISQYNHFFTWGGRNVAHFFVQFWLFVGKQFFNIANTIVYCVFIFLVQFHITGKHVKQNPALFLILNIFFWFFVPVWGQNFLWLTGSCNYLWTTTIILFFLVPFRKRQDDPDYRWNIPFSISFFFVGILAGWSNENSGTAVLFLLIAYFVIKIIRKNKFTLFEVFGMIGFLIGFSFLIAAPGNYARAESIRQYGEDGNTPLLLMFIKRFVSITLMFIRNQGFLLILISFLLGIDLLYHKKQKLQIFTYFYTLAVLVSVYSMLFSPIFPNRAFLIVIVFSIIALGNILRQMEISIPDIIKRYIIFITAVVIIYLSVPFLNTSRQIIGIYIRWYDRIEYILTEKEKDNLEIEVNPIVFEPIDKHVALYGLDDIDISSDENCWLNTSIAHYFGIKSIKKNNEPRETLWREKRKRIRQLIIPPWGIIDKLRDQ